MTTKLCKHSRRPGNCSTCDNKPKRTYAEIKRRKQLVEAWVEAHGYWCPGWEREPHESFDLTVDHTVPQAEGGTLEDGVGILCRSCNSRKSDVIA